MNFTSVRFLGHADNTQSLEQVIVVNGKYFLLGQIRRRELTAKQRKINKCQTITCTIRIIIQRDNRFKEYIREGEGLDSFKNIILAMRSRLDLSKTRQVNIISLTCAVDTYRRVFFV